MYTKKLLLGITACAMLFAASCKKSESNDNGLSQDINKIVSQDIINDLQGRGMIINKGNTPPNVSNIVVASPYTLVSSYSDADAWRPGKVIGDYKYRFSGQVGDKVQLDYKNSAGSDAGNGLGSYLSGSGNMFTLFAEVEGVASGISYKQVLIISGEVTATGVKNFQQSLVITQKTGDDNNTVLIPVGAGRIWKDGDALASFTSVYRPSGNASEGGASAGGQ